MPVTGTDFYPTLLEIAGLLPRPDQHVDGASLVPLLTGAPIEPRALYWHYPHYGNQGGEPSSIVRDGPWKLIHYYEDGRNELYNLELDGAEQNDVREQEPEKAAELFARLETWLSETGARFPVENPNFSEALYAERRERLRTERLPALEKEHAAFLDTDWTPSGGWPKSEDSSK